MLSTPLGVAMRWRLELIFSTTRCLAELFRTEGTRDAQLRTSFAGVGVGRGGGLLPCDSGIGVRAGLELQARTRDANLTEDVSQTAIRTVYVLVITRNTRNLLLQSP